MLDSFGTVTARWAELARLLLEAVKEDLSNIESVSDVVGGIVAGFSAVFGFVKGVLMAANALVVRGWVWIALDWIRGALGWKKVEPVTTPEVTVVVWVKETWRVLVNGIKNLFNFISGPSGT